MPYVRIGDQLELVATFKDEKDKATRQTEVRSLMENLGIEASYAKYPRRMSGGQKQWTRKRLQLLGFIFQDHQLLPYMRIGDQLELVAKLKGEKNKTARQAEVRALMEDLGIEASYAKYPRQMSGGQKQRAAIARAFIGNPQLILADEPTASLDPDRGQEIAQLISKEVKSTHKCAIMVTHDRSILPYVDTIYELTHGTLTRLEA